MSVLKRISAIRKRKSKQPEDEDTAEASNDEPTAGTSSSPSSSDRSGKPVGVDFIPPLELESEMPTFFTMGLLAKECLIRGYEIGIWHIECTSKSDNFNTYSIGEAHPDLSHVSGGIGIREKFGAFNLTQAWQTNGYLGMIGASTEALEANIYSVFKGFYGPHGNGAIKVDLLAGYERAPLKSEVIVPVLHSPKFMGYLLLQPADHFLFGGRLTVDVEQRKVDTHALCVGYLDDTTEYMLKLENFKNVRGSVFHRLNDRFALALKANLFGDNMKTFTVGGQFQVDEQTLLKAKISNNCQAGIVCQMKVTDQVEGIYYFGFDGKSPIGGEHKVGISWSFKA
ncbi:hypothetical protein KR093_000410 [Drosophila rubida]|uniref:Voltage-dependent anion-selective channel n=1 Tax=Drosophila rubida TaxID=30044 RepID=A0AAD4K493_9MUSC|nr:hypothetical protein KR093_000410 [Drosophila rubida]